MPLVHLKHIRLLILVFGLPDIFPWQCPLCYHFLEMGTCSQGEFLSDPQTDLDAKCPQELKRILFQKSRCVAALAHIPPQRHLTVRS